MVRIAVCPILEIIKEMMECIKSLLPMSIVLALGNLEDENKLALSSRNMIILIYFLKKLNF